MNKMTVTRVASVSVELACQYAIQINTIKREVARQCLAASVEIGRILCDAKDAVPHGEWAEWLEVNVDYSQSTANNLMRLYREYGEQSQLDFFSENKMEIFGSLSPSQALALLALPEPERKEFVESHDMENLSVRDLEKELEEAKQEAEYERNRAEDSERELSGARKAAQDAVIRAQTAEAGLSAAEKEAQDAKKKARSDIDGLKKRLKELEEEKAEAQKALEEARAAEPQQITIEVPRDLDAEPKYKEILAERDRLAKEISLADPDSVRFRMEFDRFQESFEACFGLIDAISRKDAEKGEKFVDAMRSVLSSMVDAVRRDE